MQRQVIKLEISFQATIFFSFFFVKAPWRRRRRWQRGGIIKYLKSFLAAVILSASVHRCFVSRMRDFCLFVLKGDSMVLVGHHIGPNQIHLYRSACLSLSANDQVVSTFSEQKLRSVYSTVHALGLVSASTMPSDGTGWYKP